MLCIGQLRNPELHSGKLTVPNELLSGWIHKHKYSKFSLCISAHISHFVDCPSANIYFDLQFLWQQYYLPCALLIFYLIEGLLCYLKGAGSAEQVWCNNLYSKWCAEWWSTTMLLLLHSSHGSCEPKCSCGVTGDKLCSRVFAALFYVL